MLPTPFGAILVVIGIWFQFAPYRRTVIAMIGLSVFGAASALDLPALGGSTITPANFFLVFFLLRLIAMRDGANLLLAEIGPRRPLFLFFLLTLWIVASAILLPRLFEGATSVFSLARSDADTGATPLHPTSGNISQAVYAIGGLLVACATAAYMRKPGSVDAILSAIALVTCLDIGFAILDLVTAATHTGFILDIIHTAGYTFLTDDELGGLKRISGAFSEASSFATFSLTLFSINFALFVMGIKARFTGIASLLLLGFIALSTSSAGYAGLAVFFAAFLVYAFVVGLIAHRRRVVVIAVASVTVAFLLVACVTLFLPSVASTVSDIIDQSLLKKATTDSGVERGSWNTQALQVFEDTHWLGAGIGTTRASNYALVLLSNLGVIGFALFVMLVLRVSLSRLRSDMDDEGRCLAWAARVGLLTTLVPMLLVGTTYDLGTMFYCCVGIAASGAAAPRVARAARGATIVLRQPSNRPSATFAK